MALGQVVGGEGALDAGADDDGIVGGPLGLAGGCHVRPRPCSRQAARGLSQGEGRGRVRPSGAGGGALAALQPLRGWRWHMAGGATSFPPLGAGRAGASPFPAKTGA